MYISLVGDLSISMSVTTNRSAHSGGGYTMTVTTVVTSFGY